MTLEQMLQAIHQFLKQSCYTDLVETTGVSASCLSAWRNEPPEKPSLIVFCRLARTAGLNPSIRELERLL